MTGKRAEFGCGRRIDAESAINGRRCRPEINALTTLFLVCRGRGAREDNRRSADGRKRARQSAGMRLLSLSFLGSAFGARPTSIGIPAESAPCVADIANPVRPDRTPRQRSHLTRRKFTARRLVVSHFPARHSPPIRGSSLAPSPRQLGHNNRASSAERRK